MDIFSLVIIGLFTFGIASSIAGFSRSYRNKLQKYLVPVIILTLALLIFAIAVIAGFLISFSACFKQSCSAGADNALLLFGLIGGVIGISVIAHSFMHRNTYISFLERHSFVYALLGTIFILSSLILWWSLYGIEGSSMF